MTIIEIILKSNIIIPEYPTKLYKGFSMPVTDRDLNDTIANEGNSIVNIHFISKIEFYSKDSDFVKNHRLSTGCYVLSLARNSKDYCLGHDSEEKYMIMENDVAMVLFK